MTKEKKYNFLYRTTNLINNKFYIGMHSTNNLKDGYLGSGKYLRNSIRKYGKENFKCDIIEYYDSVTELIIAEKRIVDKNLLSDINCMNLMEGGKGGFISKEQQKHRSECGGKALSNKLKTDSEFAKNFSKLQSQKMKKRHIEGKIKYNTFKGKNHTEETKRKIGESNKINHLGSKNSRFGTCWITKDGINKSIKLPELDTYITKGWIRGRKMNTNHIV